jgi:hypothetical protein
VHVRGAGDRSSGHRGKENALPRDRGEAREDDHDLAFKWIEDHDGAWPPRKDAVRPRSRSSDDFGRERRYRDRDRDRAEPSAQCADETRWVSVLQSPLRRDDACSDRAPSLSGKDRYGDTAGFNVSEFEEFAESCVRRYEVALPHRR